MNCKMTETNNANRYAFALAQRTVLKQRYVIEDVIGVGGFGITYKAFDAESGGEYAIKELYINNVCCREKDGKTVIPYDGKEHIFEHGVQRFLEEADMLIGLKDIPNVARVRDMFRENNTAYFAMDFIKGMTLESMIHANGKGYLPFEEAKDIVYKVGHTLKTIYDQYAIFHRDISPENIIIDENGEPQLIDFGTAKIYIRNQCQVHSIVLKPGFAPPEQYTGTNQGPWTDIYSLAGVFYYITSGQKIPPSPDRLAGEEYVPLIKLVPQCGQQISDSIDRALILEPDERTQSMEDFIAVLENESVKMQRYPVVSVKYQSGEGDVWRLPPDTDIVAGRKGGQNNIPVSPDTRISNRHCVIKYDSSAGEYEVSDISTNGIYLKGKRLEKNTKYRLRPGSVIILADRVCAIELGVR